MFSKVSSGYFRWFQVRPGFDRFCKVMWGYGERLQGNPC